MQHRAGAVAAVIDRIEDAGFQAEVFVALRLKDHDKHRHVEIVAPVKSAGDALDVARLAFAIGHPAALRRLFFATITRPTETKYLDDSIGVPVPIKTGGEAFVLEGLQGGKDMAFTTEEGAATTGLALIMDSLRKQGCPGIE
jgi:hypothetical protein